MRDTEFEESCSLQFNYVQFIIFVNGSSAIEGVADAKVSVSFVSCNCTIGEVNVSKIRRVRYDEGE